MTVHQMHEAGAAFAPSDHPRIERELDEVLDPVLPVGVRQDGFLVRS